MQHQWTNTLTTTMTYVGSQGHFLPADGTNARGFYADQLDPKYLGLGSNLALTGSALTSYCAANAGVCPATVGIFNTTQNLARLLSPFPFQNVTDSFGYVANSNYNALQTTANMRANHGLTFMANYTWSRSIDDGGTFRSGYALPAGTIANAPNASFPQDRIERTVSTTNQQHHVVVTGVWNVPLGKEFFNQHEWQRAIFGGFQFSEIFQAFTGSPLAITGSTCQTNPAQSTCEPTLNPAFSGQARINGKWGQGVTAANYNSTSNPGSYFIAPSIGSSTITPSGPFIAPVAPACNGGVLLDGRPCTTTGLGTALPNSVYMPAYTFGNSPRTAPYNIYGPGNYNLDLAIVRSFALHITEASKFIFRAEMYNATNHTFFAVASTAVGNANFGQVAPNTNANRKAVQLSGRIEF